MDHVWSCMDDVPDPSMAVFLCFPTSWPHLFPCVPLRSRQVLSSLRDHLGGKGRIHLKAAAASVAVLKSPREKDWFRVAWDPSISRNIEMADVLTKKQTKIASNRNYLTPRTRWSGSMCLTRWCNLSNCVARQQQSPLATLVVFFRNRFLPSDATLLRPSKMPMNKRYLGPCAGYLKLMLCSVWACWCQR